MNLTMCYGVKQGISFLILSIKVDSQELELFNIPRGLG